MVGIGDEQRPACTSCAGGDLVPFYEAAGMPCGESTRLATPEAALAVPRCTVTLAFCPACGFIRSSVDGPATGESYPLTGLPAHLAHGPRLKFELPDVLHTLCEGAFWSLCKGPASHFSPGSLARLVRASGFDVTALRRDRADTRFVLETVPADVATTRRFALEDDLAALTDAVDGFPAAAYRQASRWRRVIDESIADGKRLAVWGADETVVAFLSALSVTHAQIPTAVDPDLPAARESFLAGTGQQIIDPAPLAVYRPDVVIVLDADLRTEALARFDQDGRRPQVLSL